MMNIKDIEARINTEEQSIAILNDLKLYINYLIQEEKDDQVEKYLNKAIKVASDLQLPREEGALLIELGVYYWNKLDYKSALNMFRLSCGIFKQNNKEYDLVIATRNVGETYTKIGDYNNAISFLRLSLDFLGKVKGHEPKDLEELQADINISLGTAYRKCKSYALSMSAYFRGLELLERHNLKHKICLTNLNIGKMFVGIGNFERALKYYNKAVEVALLTNDFQIKAHAHALIGRLYTSNGKYSQAIAFYQAALGYLSDTKKNYRFNKIRILYDFALNYFELKDCEMVGQVCETSLEILQNSDNNLFKGKFKYLYGKSLDLNQEYAKAETQFNSALIDLATEDTANSLKYKILRALSLIYEKQDVYKQAYNTLVKSNNYIDLMIQEKQDKALLELEAKFESQQKVREEIMLKKVNQEVVSLTERVNNLSLLVEEYQEIDSFFGVIPKDKILQAIKHSRELHTKNGSELTTLKIRLVADQEVSQETINKILADLSKLIMFYTRNQDDVGRWGEDALVLLLPHLKGDDVEKVIEKIKLPIYNDILAKEKAARFDVEFSVLN